jgi:HNH endonuclease
MTRRCTICRTKLADHNGTPYCRECHLEARNGTLTVELWRTIPAHREWEISQRGRVRDKLTHTIRQHDLSHKYPRVSIEGRRHYVHDLLAAAFIGPKPWGLMVLHGDDDPQNTTAANMSYGDHAANAADAKRNGRR